MNYYKEVESLIKKNELTKEFVPYRIIAKHYTLTGILVNL